MLIVLYQPQIPQNTGNIVRTCAATGSELLLVRPLGFSTGSRHLKRAGLDYWDDVKVDFTDDLFAYLSSLENRNFYFFSSRPHLPVMYDISFQPSDILIFGSETEGIGAQFWSQWSDKFYTIPMKQQFRCLNLSNAVSIVLYEGLRQQQFGL